MHKTSRKYIFVNRFFQNKSTYNFCTKSKMVSDTKIKATVDTYDNHEKYNIIKDFYPNYYSNEILRQKHEEENPLSKQNPFIEITTDNLQSIGKGMLGDFTDKCLTEYCLRFFENLVNISNDKKHQEFIQKTTSPQFYNYLIEFLSKNPNLTEEHFVDLGEFQNSIQILGLQKHFQSFGYKHFYDRKFKIDKDFCKTDDYNVFSYGRLMKADEFLDHKFYFPKKLRSLAQQNLFCSNYIIDVEIDCNMVKKINKKEVKDSGQEPTKDCRRKFFKMSFVTNSIFKRFPVPFAPTYSMLEENLGLEGKTRGTPKEKLQLEHVRNKISFIKSRQNKFERYGFKLVNINDWIDYKDDFSRLYY